MAALPSHRVLAVSVALVWVACTATPPPVERNVAAPVAPGVALLLSGSAFDTPASRDEATALASERTGRPALIMKEEPTVEDVIQGAASRLDRSVARTARAEVRKVRCRKKGRPIAAAIGARVDSILRIRLDAETTSHPATAEERNELAGSRFAGILAAVGLGDGTVYETTLDGTLERTTFPGSPATARQPVRWSVRRLGNMDVMPPVTVREALAATLDVLPAPAAARWEPIARGLVSSGCPVLGTAVAETFLEDGAPKRRIRTAALAVLTPSRPAGPPPAELATATPVDRGTTTTAVAPDADPAPEPPPPPTEVEYSCTNLCALQMVELCNKDRALWTQNGAQWTNTRCGVRRREAFLANCYRMQWVSGRYERSCVQRCERSRDGRSRLVTTLRRSGCIRADG